MSGPALVFITTTVVGWRPIFSDNRLADICLAQLDECLKHYEVKAAGYVLMPSHLHALLGFKDINLLSKFMHSFKILSSKKIKEILLEEEKVNDNFRLWKPRFDDIIINSEKQFRIKLDYIHNNPLKAGLVSTTELYPYSSAKDWISGLSGPIKIYKEYEWTK